MTLLVSLVGCFLTLPEKSPCTEPHLWYAPDGSGDTYFGCEPPAGWLEIPPDESEFEPTTTTTTPADVDTDTEDIDTSIPTLTIPPEDTSPPTPMATGDTGQGPIDTAVLPDTADTGAAPTDEDTADTGPDSRDTSDTGELPPEETGDTGGQPSVVLDTAPPVDTAVLPPDDDTGTP